MAIEYKDVLRVTESDSSSLLTTLRNQMLGWDSGDEKLYFKLNDQLYEVGSSSEYSYDLTTDYVPVWDGTTFDDSIIKTDGTMIEVSDDSYLGITSDTDLLQLKSANLELNGSLSITGDINSASSLAVGTTEAVKLFLITDGTNRLAVDDAGKVGVGTISPTYALDVKKDQAASTLIQIENTDASAVAGLAWKTESGSASYLWTNALTEHVELVFDYDEFRIRHRGTDHYLLFDWDSSASDYRINTSGTGAGELTLGAEDTDLLVINAGGTDNGIYPYTDGDTSCGTGTNRWSVIYATNGTVQTSDKREKKDIEESDLGLEFISRLNPVSFKLKDENTTKKRYGLIAQEINEVVDEDKFNGVHYDKESDRYSLCYSEFIGPMIKAIQELKEEVEELKIQLKKE